MCYFRIKIRSIFYTSFVYWKLIRLVEWTVNSRIVTISECMIHSNPGLILTNGSERTESRNKRNVFFVGSDVIIQSDWVCTDSQRQKINDLFQRHSNVFRRKRLRYGIHHNNHSQDQHNRQNTFLILFVVFLPSRFKWWRNTNKSCWLIGKSSSQYASPVVIVRKMTLLSCV